MEIISWNVAGIRACAKKGLLKFMKEKQADFYAFQEVKANEEDIPKELTLAGYEKYFSPSEKKGYSGVVIYTKHKPISIIKGIGKKEFDSEGRVISLEYRDFYLINAYFPHSNRELARLDFKIKFNEAFLQFVKKLEKKKSAIIAADFNVAHEETDLANPKQNDGNAGFTKQEREWFTKFIKSGFLDTFRIFTKENGHYTWWTYRNNARERNIGWRIDYFVTSSSLKSKILTSSMLSNTKGSDHCPISIKLDLSPAGKD
jgi:exodeoxyribonuclease III